MGSRAAASTAWVRDAGPELRLEVGSRALDVVDFLYGAQEGEVTKVMT